MKLTCPHCAYRFPLEEAVEDESGRALMALLARHGDMARELILYLALFKPRTQALRWSRALALAEEVEQLAAEHGETVVGTALRETIEAMRAKQGGGWQPLRGHGYLIRVLGSVTARDLPVETTTQTAVKHHSKTAQAMQALMEDVDG